jgi:hypothetical protein
MLNRMRPFAVLCVAALCFPAGGCVIFPVPVPEEQSLSPRPVRSDPMNAFQAQVLAEHNRIRAEAGVPLLVWSAGLAEKAQGWANHLAADVHQLHHNRESGMGQNLAVWTSGQKSPQQFVDWWAAEKANFTPGTFPDVSRTGDWESVAHYTQMIWKNTAQVGCAIATGSGNDYLVCDYSPQGNVYEQRVY